MDSTRLAHINIAGRGETDHFLAAAVARMEVAGLRLAGTVQTNIVRADRTRCDMDLRVLPDGPVYRISQDRGAAARWLDGAEVLIVNKFGKAESEGRGLVPVISAALDQGMTVLVGVNALNLPPYLDFAGGLPEALPAEETTAFSWCLRRLSGHVG